MSSVYLFCLFLGIECSDLENPVLKQDLENGTVFLCALWVLSQIVHY